jgi:hypothetical protein
MSAELASKRQQVMPVRSYGRDVPIRAFAIAAREVRGPIGVPVSRGG